MPWKLLVLSTMGAPTNDLHLARDPPRRRAGGLPARRVGHSRAAWSKGRVVSSLQFLILTILISANTIIILFVVSNRLQALEDRLDRQLSKEEIDE